MLMNILYWYVVGSYIVGAILFTVEFFRNLRQSPRRMGELVFFGTVLFALSPLVAWHGVLHYAAEMYAKLTNRPVKFWI